MRDLEPGALKFDFLGPRAGMSDPTISDYIPVSVSTLKPSESAGINLYQREADEGKFVLYCAEDHPIEQQDLDRLHQRGVHRLFIESCSRYSFQSYLRDLIKQRYDADVAEAVRIQYGGSVKADNAADLLSQPNIDGALVGGASLKAKDFYAIIQAAG